MRFGVQMYGLNPIFLEDKEGFLKRITKAGFRYMEPCVMFEDFPGMEGHAWTPEQWEHYAPLLEQYGILVHSLHFFTRDLAGELDNLIRLARTYGVQQIVLPCPLYETEAEYQSAARPLMAAAEKLGEAGLELLLHNDRADSSARIGGVSAYEYLLRCCGGKVKAQADVGWLLYGGTDPEKFLWRNQKTVRSLHYKDMERTPDGLRETRIGAGLVDMTACFQFARAMEILQIADQDGSRGDFMVDMDQVGALLRGLTGHRERTKSILCLLDTVTGAVTELHTFDRVIEAPNWMRTDDDTLVYNSEGRIWKYSISEDLEEQIESGFCDNCNNDHVLSPDEKQIAVSHSQPGAMSQVYILPINGGEPRLVTPKMPSYLHGWSPDGTELAYCAFRDHGNGTEVDVYAIGADGGEEWQLTKNAAFNDGPEYSPDGKHIWFNSTRSGLMQCWRMDRDGGNPTQMTSGERNNWFPHVSPDGEKVVYLSYSVEGLDPAEHLPNMQVQLRLMNADGSGDRLLLDLFGGQGSINVNSWSSDSRRIAFVKYQLEHK